MTPEVHVPLGHVPLGDPIGVGVAVTTMTTTMPDGKKIETGSRWVVTAIKEGEQWKVSDLIQVL